MPDPTYRFPIDPHRASVERFAGALDALVAGTSPRPIDPAPLGGLVSAAERIQRIDGVVHDPAGPLSATRIDVAHRHRIWEDLMKTSTRPAAASSSGSTRARSIPSLNPWVAESNGDTRWDRIAGPRRRASTTGVLRFIPDIQPLTTFLMVIALLVAIGAGFSSLGQPGAPGVTPTAAATGDRGIAAQASPEADAEIAGIDAPFVDPNATVECAVEPRPLEEVAAFLRDPGPLSERAYLPATGVDPNVAVEIAGTGRFYSNCAVSQNAIRALATPRKIHEDPVNTYYLEAGGGLSTVGTAERKALSEALLDPEPRTYVIQDDAVSPLRMVPEPGTPVTSQTIPTWSDEAQITYTLLPSHMVRLADGRIGGPVFLLLNPVDAQFGITGQYLNVQFLIFAPDPSRGGRWAVDEHLWLCAGDCDAQWVFDAQLDPTSQPAATCPVTPLTSDQIAATRTSRSALPERQYAPVTTADVPTAEDVRAASELIAQCIEAIGADQTRLLPFMTDRFAQEIMLGMAPIGTVESARAISMQYGDALLGDQPSAEELNLFINIYTTREGGQNINPGVIGATDSRPQIVRLLPDGRAALYSADVWLNRAGTIRVPEAVPGQEVFSYTIFANQNGDWLLDEQVMVCLGDCDDYWAEMDGTSSGMPATPSSTPAALPATPAARGRVHGGA